MLKTYRELFEEVVQVGQQQPYGTTANITAVAERLRRVADGVAIKEEGIEKARRSMEDEFEMAFFAR